LVLAIQKEFCMRRIKMEKAKEILELSLKMGLSQRDTASGTGCSLGMVNAILARIKEAEVTDPLSLGSKELGSIIYPPGIGKEKTEPDFAHIDLEMKKKGVTLFLLWEEYKLEHPRGYMYSQFCAKYREYRKMNSVYMRKVYKAGERMLVDWAGIAMKYTDGGSEKTAYVFVAVLPASSFVYAQPFPDMKMESWIEGHVNAFEYYGGVPLLLVPDNTKTAVTKAGRYEAELNKTYLEMADYYKTTIVPTRPSAAKDKAPVETAVQIVERRVIAKLRHTRFLSLEELSEAFHAEIKTLNDQPFQKLEGSRRSVFLSTELHELRSLPERRYEYAQFKQAKVGFDYHVALDKAHYYSVPYQFAGKDVLIRWNSRTVEVFCEGERIGCHIRSMDPHKRFITEPSHMPGSHRAVADWSPQRFISWAEKTGVKTKEYIASLLERKEHPEQAFRTCAGILRIASTVTPERMEEACALAIEQNVYSYSYFVTLLKSLEKTAPIIHENLRGKDYFKEADHV
jgi:transposase